MKELKTLKDFGKIRFGQGRVVHVKFGSSSMCGYWNGYIISTNEEVTCKKCLEFMKKSNLIVEKEK